MPVLNHLARLVAALLLLAAAAQPLAARTKKGDKLLDQGRAAEMAQDYDKALDLLERAVAEDPSDAAYRMGMLRVRFHCSQVHVDKGQRLREDGKLEEALEEFRKAYAIDPGSGSAAQELRRTLAMIERARKKGAAQSEEEKTLTPGQLARRDSEERAASLQAVPELKPISRQISTLRMNNQPVKVLFETLGKLAGINVVIDAEYQSTGKNYSVDLTNTTLDEALEHISVLTKSFWKPLSPNTIFVTNENTTKRRDYEDTVVRVFYVSNLLLPQELQEISTAVRGVTNLRQVFTYAPQNAIIVRGTVDQVALADKLFQDLDKPKSEVVVDVIVMEASRARTRDLAAALQSGGTSGIKIPVAFTPRSELGRPSSGTGTGTGTGTPSTGTSGSQGSSVLLSELRNIRTQDFSLSLPSGLFQALMSDRGTRVLQSPQLRAADGAKSSLKIGDRFPYATGSFQPGIGTVGISPLVSTQFQFADVGVNVDITPKIHGSEEVSMQIEIDISNVRDQIDVGGLRQPVIGQRKLSHAVRLREGEVSLLGGLLQDQETRTMNGIPGLSSIPFIRRLFTSEGAERNQSELLIAIVPHIVRSQDLTDVNLRGVLTGADQTLKLSYAPRKAAAGEPEVPAPATTAAPVVEAPPPAAPKPLEPKPGGPRVFFSPPSVQTNLSATISLSVQLENGTDIAGAPMKVKYDPKMLQLIEVSRGNLMAADGQQPIFSRNIMNDTGEAAVLLNRLPGTSGVSGAGTLVTLQFTAVGRGSTEVTLTDVNLRTSQLQPLAVTTPTVKIEIR